jgi:hypothetical protein
VGLLIFQDIHFKDIMAKVVSENMERGEKPMMEESPAYEVMRVNGP